MIIPMNASLQQSSQSLLNEVKYSNLVVADTGNTEYIVAIPFKWGQVFQQNGKNFIWILMEKSRNPF